MTSALTYVVVSSSSGNWFGSSALKVLCSYKHSLFIKVYKYLQKYMLKVNSHMIWLSVSDSCYKVDFASGPAVLF